MDVSECKRIVDENLLAYLEAFGLCHWSITVKFTLSTPNDSEWALLGDCFRNLDYFNACIRLNPAEFNTADEVLKTLRHELFHVILAPFDLYREIVDEAIRGDEVKAKVYERIERHVIEQAIVNLERLHNGLCEANVCRSNPEQPAMPKKASKPKSPPKPPVKKPAAPMPKGKPKKGC